MNTSSTTRSRLAGFSVLAVVLFGAVACGTETVTETDPGAGSSQVNPSNDADGRVSADSAERKAAEKKARQDRASTLRWARDGHMQHRAGHGGLPGQP
jgi:hypothetical protein